MARISVKPDTYIILSRCLIQKDSPRNHRKSNGYFASIVFGLVGLKICNTHSIYYF